MSLCVGNHILLPPQTQNIVFKVGPRVGPNKYVYVLSLNESRSTNYIDSRLPKQVHWRLSKFQLVSTPENLLSLMYTLTISPLPVNRHII